MRIDEVGQVDSRLLCPLLEEEVLLSVDRLNVHWDNLFQPLGRGLRPMLPPPAGRLPWFQRMDPHLFARDAKVVVKP
jgi:hypothetical protein